MKISKNDLPIQNLSFQGHKKSLDKTGETVHSFYYLYDKNKYNCELELYELTVDDKYNYGIGNSLVEEPIKMPSGEVTMKIKPQAGFAYRFKLTDINSKAVSYAFDNGSVIGIFDNNADNKFNVVLNNRATINKNGPMQLIMPDGYNPEKLNEAIRQKAINPVTRTHANKFGGDFEGIIARLDDIADEGVVRIVGTPFTKDTISSHKYWTENAYRIAPDFGKEAGFEKLQVELFKRGINWVADAALVNEGFGGVHVAEMLRHGDDSFSKNMFKTFGRINLGVLPNKTEHARLKFVNAPFVVEQDGSIKSENPNYNDQKPTYIQFYDNRLASEKDKQSDEIFDTYKNRTTKNIFEITKHDDAVYPYSFEVSPYELERNVKMAKGSDGKVALGDLKTIKKICEFSNFSVVSKSDSAGIEVWDGNVDIPKLNFFSDKEGKDKGALAVRDYAITSGRYWTQTTANIQRAYLSQYIAQNVGELSAEAVSKVIAEGIAKKELPASVKNVVDDEIINNVLSGNYYSRLLKDADISSNDWSNDYSLDDYITKKAMDLPLETIPVATNLLGILTSPYIAKKPNTEDEIGISRFDLYEEENVNLPEKYLEAYTEADDFYVKYLMPKMKEVLSSVGGLSEGGDVSDYGKFVISEIAPDLTKYLILKSLNPKAEVTVDKNGKFDFSKVNEKEITMQSLGIRYEGNKTLEDEALIVLKALETGLEAIPQYEIDELKQKISNRFKGRTLDHFKLAEMILDRTESGLGWRIDATKDIASIDDVRNGHANIQETWDNVIDFWKQYNQTVLEENPHAYTTAEITDLFDLFNRSTPKGSKYISDADAERKFIEQTGITSVANYNYFFSKLPDLFAPLLLEDVDDKEGWQANAELNKELVGKLDQGWSGTNPGFLYQSPADGVINSYTFVGNHDKSRILHLLATNQYLAKSDFSDEKHKEIAAKCLKQDVSKIDYDKVSSLAIASADRLLTALEDVRVDSEEVKNAVAKLAQGKKTNPANKAEDIIFDPTAFGTKPFEIIIKEVFDEAELNGATFADRKTLEAQVLKSVLEPAFDRMKSIYKLMIALPGSPTDFAGDKVGATGYETKAKNYHQQNRNVIHWDWLSDDSQNNYKFINDYNKEMKAIANLRKRPELSALNDGDTITAKKFSEKVMGFVRYNDKSTVIVLTNNKGASSLNNEMMDRAENKPIDLSDFIGREIDADVLTSKRGIKHGITPGTVFKNARKGDNGEYVVVQNGSKLTIERRENGRKTPVTIAPEDLNTLILYKVK